ncbi:AraC family transcriptional regulator [Pseudomonas nicosulfuronedens]|uniref:AraC family transcriptional regulator n=1 Tax=Pseudomonas nicosulfuronedens TaxID=2571105 RepID=A0A5R9RAS7_9PSED|nr:AraC family transcriptional regulator [Pseudomonas nicosulfuronedens]MDH1010595.1 AraC family transcriptional regulator [Pseudomonas nicosulfuronedens]MDH1979689.1 AraC family transcriptional regulator [Pseudomonas nicosulfuronedens]MDH2028124.1 AraC family transcriptional regulator [Pseudomonas nicosulfuronedens]TLX80255.1 AraC family transcriptional regulator [Pseudomonas nicosulfuronedens]
MLHRVNCTSAALPGLRTVEILTQRSFPRHAHDEYGIGVMLEGGHRSWSGRGEIEARPCDIITVSPNELHDGIPLRGAPRRWWMLYVEPAVIERWAGGELAGREFSLPALADPPLAQRIARLLQHLPGAGADEVAEGVLDLFGELLDEHTDTSVAALPSRGVARMLERIHDDPRNAPALAELANIAGLTPYAALRRFRRELGTTPRAYLLQYRVRQAHKAIGEGRTLADAAQLAGFADQSHMTRAFARQLGLTPGQWRTSLRQRPPAR